MIFVYPSSPHAFVNGTRVELTQKEALILDLLVKSSANLFSVYGKWISEDRSTRSVFLTRLRRKLNPLGYNIVRVGKELYILKEAQCPVVSAPHSSSLRSTSSSRALSQGLTTAGSTNRRHK